MIRTVWVLLVVAGSTVYHGVWAIGASLVGVRGALYSRLTRGWARAILRAAGSPVVAHGLENLAAGEPRVIVSNHVSWFDVFAIAAVVPEPFHFVAKKELERIPLFGTAWKAAGHISIDRSNRQKAVESLRRAGEKIRAEGSSVIIFPEGTRSRSGRLQAFKKGAFMLAIEAGVPLVPTVVTGSYDIMRPDSWRVRPRTIHLHFSSALPTAALPASETERLMDRTRQIMAGVLLREEALPPE